MRKINICTAVLLSAVLTLSMGGCGRQKEDAQEAETITADVPDTGLAADEMETEEKADETAKSEPTAALSPVPTAAPSPVPTATPTPGPTATPTPTPEPVDLLAGTIEAENVGLTPDMKYAEFSAIHTDSAILYTNHYENANGFTVCVNAGHGTSGGGSVRTQCHPDGTPKVTGGTNAEGSITAMAVSSGMTFDDGTEERAVTLAEALILKDMLLDAGYNVLMIREGDDIQLDNVARTVLANTFADCHVALHWDATDWDKGCYYMSVPKIESYLNMEPVSYTWQKSEQFGDCLIEGLRQEGNKIFESGAMEADLTQTSYSSIASVDIELGDHVSDHSEETLQQLARGLLKGIDLYFEQVKAAEGAAEETAAEETVEETAEEKTSEETPADDNTAGETAAE